ncbi:hypothetical protein BK138_09370 [Paenibacillus rhizosphaerae]|uniref:Uncharacterized protein n=1 Tax=Paenibacillus rhizosphaerae TaxID=297318 RepID=A0A1R1F3Q1_9BACL|nr:hypothetical protein [Paenibacillus rhizosphaerae]OMF58697.1 hypothetical protein BK138_09370 [Paenibacillus rhizosphaerae]
MNHILMPIVRKEVQIDKISGPLANLDDLLKQKIQKAISDRASSISVPDQSVKVDMIPGLGISVSDYQLSVTGGHVNSVTTAITQFKDNGSGNYHCEMTSAINIGYSSWHEDYYVSGSGSWLPSHFKNTYNDFNATISTLSVTFDLQLADKSAHLTNGNATARNISFHLPSRSALSGNLPCVQSRINDRVRDMISKTDFLTPIRQAIESVLNQ